MATSFIGQPNLPLGLRNNNPGDLRTGISWLGASGSENGFITFEDITWGIRALGYDLWEKYNKDGLTTITQIISKYAPPSENDTQGYINNVAGFMGLDPDEDINIDSLPTVLPAMIRAIMNQELGATYSAMVTDDDIAAGIAKIPQSIIGTIANFFEAEPIIATASSLGAVAAVVVLVVMVVGKVSFKTALKSVIHAIRNI